MIATRQILQKINLNLEKIKELFEKIHQYVYKSEEQPTPHNDQQQPIPPNEPRQLRRSAYGRILRPVNRLNL